MLTESQILALLTSMPDREVSRRLGEHIATLSQTIRLAKVLLDGTGPVGSARVQQYRKFEAVLDVAGEFVREDLIP